MNFQPPGILEIGTSSEAAVQSLDNKWQNAISGVAGRDNAALLGLVTEAVGTLGLPVYPPNHPRAAMASWFWGFPHES